MIWLLTKIIVLFVFFTLCGCVVVYATHKLITALNEESESDVSEKNDR